VTTEPTAIPTAPPQPASSTGADHRVRLDAFEGPLDLLLYLIRKDELDIHDIPITPIATQYMAQLADLDRVDIEFAGEFLVMAATLMEIKSRVIAAEGEPDEEVSDDDDPRKDDEAGIDPRAELVQQLLEYRAYREAADELDRKREDWSKRFATRPAGVSADELRAAMEQDDLELEDLSLTDLAEAFAKIAASVNMDRLGEHEVISDDTPIELHAEDLLDRLRRRGEQLGLPFGQMTLRQAFENQPRSTMIGLFLAMLDLVRQRRITFRQGQDADGTRGEIIVEARDEPDPDPDPENAAAEPPVAGSDQAPS
jgi:segregation and condensation protein A